MGRAPIAVYLQSSACGSPRLHTLIHHQNRSSDLGCDLIVRYKNARFRGYRFVCASAVVLHKGLFLRCTFSFRNTDYRFTEPRFLTPSYQSLEKRKRIECGLALWWRDRLMRGYIESAKVAVSERRAANDTEGRRFVFLRFLGLEIVDDDTFRRKDTEGIIRVGIFPL